MSFIISNIKSGDRVRVVLEGEVRDLQSGRFTVGFGSWCNRVNPEFEHVKSVEVLAKQFKVGDTVSGDDYAKLPIGTGVAHSDTGRPGLYVKVGEDSWFCPESNRNDWRDANMSSVRAIVYLP